MKANNHISKNEHKLLLIVAFMTFVFAVVSFISFSIENYNNEVKIEQSDLEMKANYGAAFAVDAGPDYRPVYRFWFIFFILFSFLALRKTKRFLLPTFIISFLFVTFIYWIYRTNKDIELNESYMSGTPHLLKIATSFDYLVFLFVSILLFWQISILLRMLVKTSQREKALP